MNVRALVCALGAAGVVSCGSGMTAREIRSSGRILQPQSAASVAAPQFRVTSCLEMGRKWLGNLSVQTEIASFDLESMSCDDCRVQLSFIVPDGWTPPGFSRGDAPPLETLRMGYVYGYLTLSSPSDSVLEEVGDICTHWSQVPAYVPECDWRNMREDVWQSGVFAALVTDGEPMFAPVSLVKPSKLGERRLPIGRFPVFSEPMQLDLDMTFAPIIAAVFSYSGYLGFVPTAIEVVDPRDGELLGCLPASY